MAKLTDIQGVDTAVLKRLKEIGIRSTEGLLKEGSTGAGILSISLRSGVERNRIESVVTQVDLMRIRGVGWDYAELLEAAGVHSVRELSAQDPMALSDALLEANLLGKLVEAVPSENRVSGWVRQAQGFQIGH